MPLSCSPSPKKILWITGVGNALELYDYVLYAALLPHLLPHFFPSEEWGSVLGFLSFALTFLVAPFGAWVWGKYANAYGLAQLLRSSMIWMGLPALGIACLPTYGMIGFWAPVLLMGLRLLQGISISAEAMGSKLYAMEALGVKEQMWSSGVLSALGALGVALAMLMGKWVSEVDFPWAWRLPFILGSGLFFVARLIRRLPALQGAVGGNTDSLQAISLKHPYASCLVFFLGAHLGVTSYTLHAFLNPFVMKFGLNPSEAYAFSLLGLLLTAIIAMATGRFCPSRGKFKITLNICFLVSAFLSFPCLWLCQSGSTLESAIGYSVLAVILGAYATVSAVLMYAVFDQKNRTKAVLFYYALGCSVFGGLTPLCLEALSRFHTQGPGVFLTLWALGGFGLFRYLYSHVHLH
jgi:MFS family permease